MTRSASQDAVDATLRQIRQRTKDYFQDLGSDIVVEFGRPIRRPYSRIYKALITDEANRQRRVVIKFLGDADSRFRSMCAVWPGFSKHPTWRIPRPIDCLDGAIVMEDVAGKPVQDRLPWIAGPESIRRAATDCDRAGQWLRFYHHLGLVGEGKLDMNKKWMEFEQSLEEVSKLGIDFSRCRLIRERVEHLAEQLGNQLRPVSHIHGEFTADNVLIKADRVIGLDLAGDSRNTVDHDIASFLNSMLLLRLTRPLAWAKLKMLEESFLHGYFGSTKRNDAGILFLQITGLCDVILEVLSRHRTVAFRRWIEWQFLGAVEVISRGYGGSVGS